MDMPVQGDWEFTPILVLLEDTTMAGLQAQITDRTSLESQSPTDLFLVEEIEYSTVVV